MSGRGKGRKGLGKKEVPRDIVKFYVITSKESQNQQSDV